MKALVVYESMYGNTAEIGGVIADTLSARGFDVERSPASAVVPQDACAVDLLVIGGPTHAHGMSRAGTRRVGIDDKKNAYASPTGEPGLREWMKDLPDGRGRMAAAFDTRFDKPVALTGSAARGIARRLNHAGFDLITGPESFFVTTENRLVDGEPAHAEQWAATVGERAAARIEGRVPAA